VSHEACKIAHRTAAYGDEYRLGVGVEAEQGVVD
jgi:hypothetical protein